MIPMLKLRQILPSRSDYPGFRAGWRHDLLAGVAVGVVALPLALAFGISTGTGAASGLVTAIVAGFIAALFGGSRFQVSGPTGRKFQRWAGRQLSMRLSLLLHSVPLSQFFQPALRMEWNMRKLIYMMEKNMIQIVNYLVRV